MGMCMLRLLLRFIISEKLTIWYNQKSALCKRMPIGSYECCYFVVSVIVVILNRCQRCNAANHYAFGYIWPIGIAI